MQRCRAAEKSVVGRTGGEGGIRTPDTVARMPHFECGAFNHSATSPEPDWAVERVYLSNAARANKSAVISLVLAPIFRKSPLKRARIGPMPRGYCEPARPARRMISPHTAISDLMKPGRSAGGDCTGASPSLTNSWCTSGSAITARTS